MKSHYTKYIVSFIFVALISFLIGNFFSGDQFWTVILCLIAPIIFGVIMATLDVNVLKKIEKEVESIISSDSYFGEITPIGLNETVTLIRGLNQLVRHFNTLARQAQISHHFMVEDSGGVITALRKNRGAIKGVQQAIKMVLKNASQQGKDIKSINDLIKSVSMLIDETKNSFDFQLSCSGNVNEAINSITEAIEHVSEDISDISVASMQTIEIASHGKDKVETMVTSLQKINEKVNNIADQMAILGQSTEKIGQIIDVISDIAGQTNLLALNAAIEAARAGDVGKGFAVVADEVRKLADRATDSTNEIAGLINAVQSLTSKSIDTMEEGKEIVNEGVSCIGDAKKSLDDILVAVKRNSSQIENISAASQQVNASSHETIKTMGQLTDSINQTSEGVAQMASFTTDIQGCTSNNSTDSTVEVSEAIENNIMAIERVCTKTVDSMEDTLESITKLHMSIDSFDKILQKLAEVDEPEEDESITEVATVAA